MAEQNQFSIGDEVLILTGDGDARRGIFVASNENTTTEKLLYSIKIENSFWIGPASRVFPRETAIEEATALVSERENKLAQEIAVLQAQRDEEERRRTEALAAEAEEEAEEQTTE